MPNARRAHEADRIWDHIGENGGDARFVAPCQRRFVEDIRTRHAPRRAVAHAAAVIADLHQHGQIAPCRRQPRVPLRHIELAQRPPGRRADAVGRFILPRFRQGDVSRFLRVDGRFCQRLRQQKAQRRQQRGDSLHSLHPRYFLIVVTPSSQRKYTVSGSSVTPSLANSSSTVSRMYPCS